MMYALNLSKPENRVLSVCFVLPSTPEEMPQVDSFPEGNIYDYLFVNGEYVYNPLPTPEPPEPEPTYYDRLEAQVTYTAMMTDTLLEDGDNV